MGVVARVTCTLGGVPVTDVVYDKQLDAYVTHDDASLCWQHSNDCAASCPARSATFGEMCQQCYAMPGARLTDNQFSLLRGELDFPSSGVTNKAKVLHDMYLSACQKLGSSFQDKVLLALWHLAWHGYQQAWQKHRHDTTGQLVHCRRALQILNCIQRFQDTITNTSDTTNTSNDQVQQCVKNLLKQQFAK